MTRRHLARGGCRASSGGGCFIATATTGNYNHHTVIELRNFRDEYLDKRKWGKSFIKSYYKYSPFFANIIAKHKTLRAISYVLVVKPLALLSKIFTTSKKI